MDRTELIEQLAIVASYMDEAQRSLSGNKSALGFFVRPHKTRPWLK